MPDWGFVVLLVAAAALSAGAAGFWLGYRRAGMSSQHAAMERELAAARAEHERMRAEVNRHFEQTAELFDQLTATYRALYHHLADGSQRLGAERRPDDPARLSGPDAVLQSDGGLEAVAREQA